MNITDIQAIEALNAIAAQQATRREVSPEGWLSQRRAAFQDRVSHYTRGGADLGYASRMAREDVRAQDYRY